MDDRIGFLDSFRGVLCLSVMITHNGIGKQTIPGFYFGVVGFFILSSFLLTYRLIKQYENAKTVQMFIRITINYFIMRFFRIYIPYIVYCILTVKVFNNSRITTNHTMYELITLKNFKQINHIWTMPIEINFYFFVPSIALIFSLIYKKTLLVWSLFLINCISLILIRKFRLFSIGSFQDVAIFQTYLPIFLIGSTLSIVYINFQQSKWILEYLNQSKQMNSLLSLIFFSIFIFICRIQGYITLIRDDAFIYSAFISILILIMLISPSNYFNQTLLKLKIFNLYGKYSYGTYLFHINCNLFTRRKLYRLLESDRSIIFLAISLIAGILFFYIVENNSIRVAKFFMNQVNNGFSPSKERKLFDNEKSKINGSKNERS